MAEAQEKAVCKHCNKEVATTNLPMHEAHCQRFLCLCPECDEQVPKDQLEEHRVEQHTLVKCKKCKMKMEKYRLTDHEINECTERLQSCEFCELSLPLSNLEEHTVACGSRTERCEDCNQYVRLKDRVQHAKTCMSEDCVLDDTLQEDNSPPGINKAISPQRLIKYSDSDSDSEKLGDLEHGESDLYRDTESTESKNPGLTLSALQKKKYNSKTEWADQEQISTCPLCHLALPVMTLKWHERKCRIFESLKQKQ